MSKFSNIKFRCIFKILLAASIVIGGISLIIGCALIYFGGNGYSREIVCETFSKINIPIYLSLAFIVIDVIWELLSPTTKESKKTNKKANDGTNIVPNKKTKIIQICVLGFAIIILLCGAIFNGYSDVLTKAVNICTECIGLG